MKPACKIAAEIVHSFGYVMFTDRQTDRQTDRHPKNITSLAEEIRKSKMSAYSCVTKLTKKNQNMVDIDNTVSQSLIKHNSRT